MLQYRARLRSLRWRFEEDCRSPLQESRDRRPPAKATRVTARVGPRPFRDESGGRPPSDGRSRQAELREFAAGMAFQSATMSWPDVPGAALARGWRSLQHLDRLQ